MFDVVRYFGLTDHLFILVVVFTFNVIILYHYHSLFHSSNTKNSGE